ncbi:MAG TPA: phage baseplate assembly protein V [Gaiella sp.]|nr:phage baseplate assembly protein V [Gaiella sp.]
MSQRNAVYRGFVVEGRDPDERGRVQVSLPEFDEQVWAARATLDAGDERGTWFVPANGDEVLVAFESGDERRPVVIGSLWSSDQRPPESDPKRTLVRTRHGATAVLDEGNGAIEVSDLHGNVVTLSGGGVTIRSASKVKLTASMIEIDAGTIRVNAAVSEFSGLVQCDALTTNSVVSSSGGDAGVGE